MPRVHRISDIFQKASEIKSKFERIDYLRRHSSKIMQSIVTMAYHPDVQWLLPRGSTKYRPADPNESDGTLHREIGRFYLFLQGGNPNLSQFEREKLFINLLEKLHPEDAKLVLSIKDRKINYPFLSYNFFKEAFPEWLPDEPDVVDDSIVEKPENTEVIITEPLEAVLIQQMSLEKKHPDNIDVAKDEEDEEEEISKAQRILMKKKARDEKARAKKLEEKGTE